MVYQAGSNPHPQQMVSFNLEISITFWKMSLIYQRVNKASACLRKSVKVGLMALEYPRSINTFKIDSSLSHLIWAKRVDLDSLDRPRRLKSVHSARLLVRKVIKRKLLTWFNTKEVTLLNKIFKINNVMEDSLILKYKYLKMFWNKPNKDLEE